MHFLAVSATIADCDLYWRMEEELLWEIRDAITPYKPSKRAAAFSQTAADEDHIRICNSQAAMLCKQLLLFHIIVQFWILPRGRTGQRPVFFFCKKLINDSQLQNLCMIFLLGRGNSGGQRATGRTEEEANRQTSDGDSWLDAVTSIKCL